MSALTVGFILLFFMRKEGFVTRYSSIVGFFTQQKSSNPQLIRYSSYRTCLPILIASILEIFYSMVNI